MFKWLSILFSLFVVSLAAFADVIRIDANSNVIRGSVRAEMPDTFKTDSGETINNYKHATYRHQSDGWRIYFACPSVAGSNLAVTGSIVTDETVTDQCAYSAPPPAAWSIQPDTTIPILDGTNQVGTARIIAAPDLSLIAVTNSASPERSMAEQLASYQAEQVVKEAQKRAIRDSRSKNVQAQLDAIRAYLGVQE